MADRRLIEAPEEWDDLAPSIFLAGGITDCPDWQSEAAAFLERHATLLNPRRAVFPIHDPSAAQGQIEWEWRHLARATVVLFWFPASTSPQPIALYELGRHAALGRRLAVGVSDGYARRADVRIQLGLARPDIEVRDALWQTCADAVVHLADERTQAA